MIINNLNALAATHAALQRMGVVRSKADFSTRFLEKTGSYLTSMQTRSRSVPDVVMATLEWSLQRELLSYAQNTQLGASYAIRLNQAYGCIEQQLQFVRRHRASLTALSMMAPANDAGPAEFPPQHMQGVLDWVGKA